MYLFILKVSLLVKNLNTFCKEDQIAKCTKAHTLGFEKEYFFCVKTSFFGNLLELIYDILKPLSHAILYS